MQGIEMAGEAVPQPNPTPEILLTLVHGTWGGGLLPRLRLTNQPFWFEDGSVFRTQLCSSLRGRNIQHDVSSYLWSGANSVFQRDKAALGLARSLIAETEANPRATQMIIAHSHGGNIALRALHHLKSLKPTQTTLEKSKLFVVTMATPFVEVHLSTLSRASAHFTLVGFLAGFILFMDMDVKMNEYLFEVFKDNILLISVCNAAVLLPLSFIIQLWGRGRHERKELTLTKLMDATALPRDSGSVLLVVRAIDDEASLTLAFGAILNRVIPLLTYILAVLTILLLLVGGVIISLSLERLKIDAFKSPIGLNIFAGAFVVVKEFSLVTSIPFAFIGMLLILFFGRAAYGREMALAPLEAQINTHSAPDGVALSKLVTLVSRRAEKHLRHGIYEHVDCAATIADWASAQMNQR